LAAAVAPYGGIVLWRSFVYTDSIDTDRMKRAYKEFMPLDGKFNSNVVIQSKNGPFDFQPREPIHPLFGAMLKTHVASEFQITKEYLGQSKQLVYLGPYWKEVLDFDTYAKGVGSTVSKVLDGSLYGDTLTVMSGVANTGTDSNWCGHQFNQANWYAFGRLAWNHNLSSDTIADEWTKMTWGWNSTVVSTIKTMLKGSREACVNYMDPLGLGGIFSSNAHYGPEPSYNGSTTHADWNSVYWHKADTIGVGYNRTSATGGSDFVDQYFPHNKSIYDTITTCPLEYLCWFHHVPWSRQLSTGRTFWNELCYRYYDGVAYVTKMKSQWASLSGLIDAARFSQVTLKLDTNEKDAKIWRDTCIKYFQKFSKLSIPTYTAINTNVVNNTTTISNAGRIVRIYTVQGKLIKTIDTKAGSSAFKGISIARGVYIIKRDGVSPYRFIVGSGQQQLINLYR
jgi:alpha-glucuronidase